MRKPNENKLEKNIDKNREQKKVSSTWCIQNKAIITYIYILLKRSIFFCHNNNNLFLSSFSVWWAFNYLVPFIWLLELNTKLLIMHSRTILFHFFFFPDFDGSHLHTFFIFSSVDIQPSDVQSSPEKCTTYEYLPPES